MPGPPTHPNSRLKDLVDVALLADRYSLEADRLMNSIRATFEFRSTHELPEKLPGPPSFWPTMYEKLRSDDQLRWEDLDALQTHARAFLDPLLENPIMRGVWSPDTGEWRVEEAPVP